ncbi:MAG: class I SAM-dependent methyltransferase [Myxococcales bacterium]|nr:class I SAM-dependent methyltransferase [Myxococcales bacterium]
MTAAPPPGATTRAERAAMTRTPADQREHERAQVAAHYQNDPDIFRVVLGRQLAYSVGLFASPHDDLEAAQDRKLAYVRRQLDLRPGRVLDVGCGWGSVLCELASATEATVHGLTLSSRQRDRALERAHALGAGDRVRIDVAHVEGLDLPGESVDAIVFSGSIVHMHAREAVHALVARALKPGGRVLISDCYFPRQVRGDRDSRATAHIFETALGYCRLVPLAEELGWMDAVGLDVRRVEDVTEHYVRTVDCWVDNIRRHRAFIEARAPGFARLLQTYMMVGRMSFARRTALEYMITAVKGRPREATAGWPVPGVAP